MTPKAEPAVPAPAPEVDLSGYIKKEDLDKRLSELGTFVTEEELEDRVLRVIQEKMMPSSPKTVKRTKVAEKDDE